MPPQGGFDVAVYGGDGPDLPGDTSQNKWTDGGQRFYSSLGETGCFIYEWTKEEESIIFFVYESKSDCEYESFCFSEQDDDPVFSGIVH